MVIGLRPDVARSSMGKSFTEVFGGRTSESRLVGLIKGAASRNWMQAYLLRDFFTQHLDVLPLWQSGGTLVGFSRAARSERWGSPPRPCRNPRRSRRCPSGCSPYGGVGSKLCGMARLSLCMIVRDEASTLAQAIAPFEGVADEIVIVDTGSDRRHDRRRGGRWSDGGAPPLAGQLRRGAQRGVRRPAPAIGIFALDADERLLPESRDEVRRLVDEGAAQGYLVTRRDLTPRGRFRDAVHASGGERSNNDWSTDSRALRTKLDRREPSGILIEHDGYAGPKNEARLGRNVRLLELELRDRPGAGILSRRPDPFSLVAP